MPGVKAETRVDQPHTVLIHIRSASKVFKVLNHRTIVIVHIWPANVEKMGPELAETELHHVDQPNVDGQSQQRGY